MGAAVVVYYRGGAAASDERGLPGKQLPGLTDGADTIGRGHEGGAVRYGRTASRGHWVVLSTGSSAPTVLSWTDS